MNKMDQNLPKKLLLLIYINVLRDEPIHAVMVQFTRAEQTHVPEAVTTDIAHILAFGV